MERRYLTVYGLIGSVTSVSRLVTAGLIWSSLLLGCGGDDSSFVGSGAASDAPVESSAPSTPASGPGTYQDDAYSFEVVVNDVSLANDVSPPNYSIRASVTVTNTSGSDYGRQFSDAVLVAAVRREQIGESYSAGTGDDLVCEAGYCRQFLETYGEAPLVPPGEPVTFDWQGPAHDQPGFVVTGSTNPSEDIEIYLCPTYEYEMSETRCNIKLYPAGEPPAAPEVDIEAEAVSLAKRFILEVDPIASCALFTPDAIKRYYGSRRRCEAGEFSVGEGSNYRFTEYGFTEDDGLYAVYYTNRDGDRIRLIMEPIGGQLRVDGYDVCGEVALACE